MGAGKCCSSENKFRDTQPRFSKIYIVHIKLLVGNKGKYLIFRLFRYFLQVIIARISFSGIAMNKISVLLAEYHTIVSEWLKSILEGEFDLIGIVPDGRSLVETAKELKPDVIVTDISMLLNGLDAVRQIKREGLPTKIICLTMHTDIQLATEAFRAGASGYLLKQSASQELNTAIHEVVKGHAYVTPLITSDVLSFLMDI